MRRGTLSNGFQFELDERRIDMRFVDELSSVLGPNVADQDALLKYPRLVTILLGEEQKQALYDRIAAQHEGFVPIPVFKRLFEELINSPEDDLEKK